MPLFVVVLLKKRVIIKKQKENRKTREIKVEIKRRLRPILHQTEFLLDLLKFNLQYIPIE